MTYGMETAFFRFANDKEHEQHAFQTGLTSLFLTSLLILVPVFFLSQQIASLIGFPDHPEYIKWLVLIIGFDVLSVLPFALLRKKNKAFRFAGLKLINIAINIGLNLFFLVLCPYLINNQFAGASFAEKIYSREFGIGYIFISNILASGITFLLLAPEWLKSKWTLHKPTLKKMLSYGWPILAIGLFGMINELSDRIFLQNLLNGTPEENESQVGIYSACYKLAILMTLVTQGFRYAAEPFFFAQSGKENAPGIYADMTKYFVIVGTLVFLGVSLFTEFFAQLFLRQKEYWEGLAVVPILLMAQLFLGIFYNLSVWYKVTDKTRFGAAIAGIGASATILINVILIPKVGYYASALATFVCYVLMTILSFYWSKKHYPIPFETKTILKYMMLSTLLFFVSYFVLHKQFRLEGINFNIVNALILVGYLVYIYFDNKFFIKQLLPNKKI